MGTPRRYRARGAPRPSKLLANARGRWWYQGANGRRRTRNTRGICHTGSVKSNPGTRPRGRNPIAGPAERFSPTRIYPECSAQKRKLTRAHDADEIDQEPKAQAAQGGQLQEPGSGVAEVEPVDPKHAEQQGQLHGDHPALSTRGSFSLGATPRLTRGRLSAAADRGGRPCPRGAIIGN